MLLTLRLPLLFILLVTVLHLSSPVFADDGDDSDNSDDTYMNFDDSSDDSSVEPTLTSARKGPTRPTSNTSDKVTPKLPSKAPNTPTPVDSSQNKDEDADHTKLPAVDPLPHALSHPLDLPHHPLDPLPTHFSPALPSTVPGKPGEELSDLSRCYTELKEAVQKASEALKKFEAEVEKAGASYSGMLTKGDKTHNKLGKMRSLNLKSKKGK